MTNPMYEINKVYSTFEENRMKARGNLKEAFESHVQNTIHKDENSIIRSFSWVQYTPYFNDGDTCEFSIDYDLAEHGLEIDIARYLPPLIDVYLFDGDEVDEAVQAVADEFASDLKLDMEGTVLKIEEYSSDLFRLIEKASTPEHVTLARIIKTAVDKALRNIESSIGDLPEDELLYLFGDHVKVTFDGTHFSTQDYEHD